MPVNEETKMHQPLNPERSVFDSTVDAWQQAPGNFSKRERFDREFVMAALVARTDVTITHCHLDLSDRPTLVAEHQSDEHVTVLVDATHEGTNVLIKAATLPALATGLELVTMCLRGTLAA
jgi:imidazoleglycerol phosphate dehydratase HisB